MRSEIMLDELMDYYCVSKLWRKRRL